MHSHLLEDIGACIVAAAVLSYAARLLRQPLILAYIAAGVLIGPVGLGVVSDQQSIQTLAELGLAFLLFIVGLELDPAALAASGRAALIATSAQVAGSGALGWAAARALGWDGLPALYIGAALAFSSTMIVIKLLSDRAELDTLPGRMTLAALLIQDVLAIAVLAVQPQLGAGGAEAGAGAGGGSAALALALSLLKGAALVVGTLLARRFALPPLFRYAAHSLEILLLSAIAWLFAVSYAAMQAGFSVAMGALIAGVGLAHLPYTIEVIAKIQSLRDFFVTLFFVSLGMLVAVPTKHLLLATAVLSLLVVASRFLTLWPALRLVGFDNRIGVLCSIHLAQVSEFALVIVLIGVSGAHRHIGPDVVSLVVMTLIVTSTLSTYLVRWSDRIAAALVRALAGTPLGDRQMRARAAESAAGAQGEGGGEGEAREAPPIVLVGCHRVASSLIDDLRRAGKRFSVIDFNPVVHARLQKMGIPCTYGDVGHLDTLEHAGVGRARFLVSSISDDFLRGTDNRKLLEALRKLNPEAKIFVTADSIRRALDLYQAGADFVIVPRVLAAERLLEAIEMAEAGELDLFREMEIERLAGREEVVP